MLLDVVVKTQTIDWFEVAKWLVPSGAGILVVFRKKIKNAFNFFYFRIPLIRDIRMLKTQLPEMSNKINAILTQLTSQNSNSVNERMNILVRGIDKIGDDVSKITARGKLSENNLPYATFSTDEMGRFSHVNEIFCEWTGHEESEILNNNWVNSIHSDDQDFAKQHLMAAIFDNRDLDINFRLQHTDGIYFKVRCVAKPVYNGKKLVGYVGSIKKL